MMRIRQAGLVVALLWPVPLVPVWAQDVAEVDPAAEVVEAKGLLDPDALDALMAPVALYPDLLLAQVLFATTYPLDVVKADRFLLKSAAMPEAERASTIAAQPWAEPVLALAAGFPELVGRMAENIDWTEQVGDAVIAQTDDVLDAVQRLRNQAQANGYLEDNAAMTVATDNETGDISISSANAEVIYVPTYTDTVYTQQAPATAVVITDNNNWGDALATGAIVFGTALIIDNIFNDNDWNDGWGGGYWRGDGGNNIDWNGDVNIDNSVDISGGGGINIGNGIGNGGGGIGNGAGGIGNGDRQRPDTGMINVDRDSLRDRTDRPAALDGDRPRNRPGSGATDVSRDAARDKIARRQAAGGAAATLPASLGKGDRAGNAVNRPAAGATAAGNRSAVNRPAAAKPAADRARAATSAGAKPNIARPKAGAAPKGPTRARAPSKAAPAFKPGNGGNARAAASRGKASTGNRRR